MRLTSVAKRRLIGILLTAAWIAVFGALLWFKWGQAWEMKPNEWGDFLAGFSAPLVV
jgi:hypothetical protein